MSVSGIAVRVYQVQEMPACCCTNKTSIKPAAEQLPGQLSIKPSQLAQSNLLGTSMLHTILTPPRLAVNPMGSRGLHRAASVRTWQLNLHVFDTSSYLQALWVVVHRHNPATSNTYIHSPHRMMSLL
jgi:hypothetical protein